MTVTGQINGLPQDVAAGAAVMPASFVQELIWTIDQAAPDAALYNVPRTRRIGGPLDVAALRAAFDDLVARHEILRTSYAVTDERTVQVIHPPAPALFSIVDLSNRPVAERLPEAERFVRESSRIAFDLVRDTPLRVALVRLDANDHVLLVNMHHIASDGRSRDILFGELDMLYQAHLNGQNADLPTLSIQYADFAVWERSALAGERGEALLRFWRSELEGAELALDLPTDHPRSNASIDDAVSRSIVLGSPLVRAIATLARQCESTLYMTVLAAFQTLLHRYTGQTDILVGSPVTGRTRPETEGLIGCFASVIPLCTRFAGNPAFAEVLQQVRERVIAGVEHAELPFERLALELQPARDFANSPLLRVVFTLIDIDSAAGATLGSLDLRPFRNETATTKFDLTLFMQESDGTITLTLRARSALWRPATIDGFLGHLRTLLGSAVAAPQTAISELEVLDTAERDALAAWNRTARAVGPAATIDALIDGAIARVPDRIALVCGDERISYAQLGERATRFARRLQAHGVVAGERVGLLLDRSIDAVVALLAVLKAQAAYVPLSLPASRCAQQLAQSSATLVVTSDGVTFDLPPGVTAIRLDHSDDVDASSPPAPIGLPERLAYVLFTSGSTGVPKGAAITHSNVVSYVRAIARVLADVDPAAEGDGLAALDGWSFAMVSSLSADLGYTALYPALAAGATLHIIPTEIATDSERFAAYFTDNEIDVLKITPSQLSALVPDDAEQAPPSRLPRRWLVCGGEPLSFDLAARLVHAGECRIINHYGPTETTIGACTFEVTDASLEAARAAGAQTVPIGAPLVNVRVEVRHPSGALVPIGGTGELIIAGAGVGLGYFGRPDATGERFGSDAAGSRTYRSGDRVRRLSGGALEFLGRLDDQVKIRGHRVELGEIEAVLAAHPLTKQAAVRAWGDGGEAVLAAYVVAADEAGVSPGDLRATLRAHVTHVLPDHMQPRTIQFIDAIPLGANGKLARRALPPPVETSVEKTTRPAGPRESELISLFAAAFNRPADGIGPDDDFASLGGHSLLAIRLLGRISRHFGVRLGLRTLFDAPSIAVLAERIDIEIQLAALETMSDAQVAHALSTRTLGIAAP